MSLSFVSIWHGGHSPQLKVISKSVIHFLHPFQLCLAERSNFEDKNLIHWGSLQWVDSLHEVRFKLDCAINLHSSVAYIVDEVRRDGVVFNPNWYCVGFG